MLKNKRNLKSMFLIILLLSFILSPGFGGTSFASSKDFSDVPVTHDFYTTITELAGRGVVNGYGDGRFGPEDNITRAQVAVMIVKALGIKNESVSSNFTDVPNTHWASKQIATASAAGILRGYGDGRFGPEDYVTRAELSVMIANAYRLKVDPLGVKKFSDVPPTYWAIGRINALVSNKVVGGYRDGRFGPDNHATRAQFTKFLINAERAVSNNSSKAVIITDLDKKAEYVEITNVSNETVDISGWVLVSETGNQSFEFPVGTLIEPGQTIRLTSGAAQGTGDFTMAYTNIWNDSTPDPAVLYNSENVEVSRLVK